MVRDSANLMPQKISRLAVKKREMFAEATKVFAPAVGTEAGASAACFGLLF